MTLPNFVPFQGEEHRPFRLDGGRPAALLVHGFPGTPAEMRPLGKTLHGEGWTTEGILLPGFGTELESLPTRKQDHWVQHVQQSLIALSRHHHPLVLIGNSMGGALALQVAARLQKDKPDTLNGIVLLAPFWRINHVLWHILPLLKHVFPSIQPFKLMKPDFTNPETRAGIANFMPGADVDDPEVQQAIREFKLPLALFDEIRRTGAKAHKVLPSLNAPMLIIQGTQDQLVSPMNTRRLLRRMRGTVQYVEVAASHDLVKSDLPAWSQVKRAVIEFAHALERQYA